MEKEKLPPFPRILWLNLWYDIEDCRDDIFMQPQPVMNSLPRIHRLARFIVSSSIKPLPENPYRDPYIAAALIALAQEQRAWDDRHGFMLGHPVGDPKCTQ